MQRQPSSLTTIDDCTRHAACCCCPLEVLAMTWPRALDPYESELLLPVATDVARLPVP